MPKYKLKKGVVLKPYGDRSEINNDNLTDEIAEFLIETKKARKEDFEQEEKSTNKK